VRVEVTTFVVSILLSFAASFTVEKIVLDSKYYVQLPCVVIPPCTGVTIISF
jgi:hypothetical protein